jgi:hypothetical protein
MAKNDLTFEAIDEHISAADLKSIAPGGKYYLTGGAAANPAVAIPNICAAYKIVRPILKAVAAIPFLKQSWKDALNSFLTFMDALCP